MPERLAQAAAGIPHLETVRHLGTVTQVVGTVVEVRGLRAPIGDLCWIDGGPARPRLAAEVVGFRDGTLLLMPFGELTGVGAGNRVHGAGAALQVPVGPALLGRVIDAMGRPLDDGPPLPTHTTVARYAAPPPALTRQRITEPQQTGVKAIDAFVTCAKGQRVGIFAGSGVGKSVLLGMITRHTDADVNVVALIGERGREVREFLEEDLGPEGLQRTVVVVATSDQSPVLRVRAAEMAMSIGEWFREHNQNVMMVMDSVTRYAMAWREIGLAVGEPPTTKGYTPSVFAELARLLERAGTSTVNAMTAFFTVLVEGDDLNDPVADAVRSIADGHVVLSRDLARSGHYPAIDVMGSVSRLMSAVTAPEHRDAASRLLGMMKLLEDNEDLISIGAYRPGGNPRLDRAVRLREAVEAFLRQDLGDHVPMQRTLAELTALAARD